MSIGFILLGPPTGTPPPMEGITGEFDKASCRMGEDATIGNPCMPPYPIFLPSYFKIKKKRYLG
jgi:hypothetical protein